MNRCKYCGERAIIRLRYANLSLCGEHFKQYYEGRIEKILSKHRVRGRILVAVSGGKDSMSLLHALNRLSERLGLEIYAFHIDLGIPGYSSTCRNTVRAFAAEIRVPLIVYDMVEELDLSMPEIIRYSQRPPCAVCGVVRRWIMNKVAYESGFDYIATGHNLDDSSTYYLKALLTQDIYSILRGQTEILDPIPEMKLVGRIRPQFYLTERENRLYASLCNIPVVSQSCPYSRRAKIHKYRRAWSALLRVNPIAQINLTRTMLRLRKMISAERPELKLCMKCGFPTESPDAICSFCKLIERARRASKTAKEDSPTQ